MTLVVLAAGLIVLAACASVIGLRLARRRNIT